ncbi:hypothetical protein BASA60_010443 [Batrachochytrium salamandrivorans]|nr:hypothetical protein BASA60_010443 [Batrachochytrium salamandrivorans]
MSSKYTTLPDIDTETPDLYESQGISQSLPGNPLSYTVLDTCTDNSGSDFSNDDDADADASRVMDPTTKATHAMESSGDPNQIIRRAVSTTQAMSVFKEAEDRQSKADAEKLQASAQRPPHRRSRNRRNGGGSGASSAYYHPRHGEAEAITLSARAAPDETIAERYRRLSMEVEMLSQSLANIKAEEAEATTTPLTQTIGSQTSKPSKQTSLSHTSLVEKVVGLQADLAAMASDPHPSVLEHIHPGNTNLVNSRHLITAIQEFKSMHGLTETVGVQQPLDSKAAASIIDSTSGTSLPSTHPTDTNNHSKLTYELFYSPRLATDKRQTRIIELESRLTNLERLIGTHVIDPSHNILKDDVRTSIFQNSSSSADEGGSGTLIGALERIDHRLSMLSQPRVLESVARRVQTLLPDLHLLSEHAKKMQSETLYPPSLGDAVNKTASADTGGGGGEDGDDAALAASTAYSKTDRPDTRIRYLYTMLSRLEPVSHLLPHLISRMRALQGLHGEAAVFSQSLSAATEEQVRISGVAHTLHEALELALVGMKDNHNVVVRNVTALDQRIQKLVDLYNGSQT